LVTKEEMRRKYRKTLLYSTELNLSDHVIILSNKMDCHRGVKWNEMRWIQSTIDPTQRDLRGGR
jgi:hypothetical protein